LTYRPPFEAGDGAVEGEGLDQHAQAARRAAAGDGEGDAGLAQLPTAAFAASVSTLSWVTSVPSTSEHQETDIALPVHGFRSRGQMAACPPSNRFSKIMAPAPWESAV